MSKMRATYATGPLFLAAVGLIAAFTFAVMFASPAYAAKKKVVDTTTSIYRCTLDDNGTSYSDQRCKGAKQVQRWRAGKVPPGITPSNKKSPMDLLGDQTDTMNQQRDDPYTACRKIGGKYYVAAKLCKLPPEARIRIWVR
ncbi:MAG: hypothetical protein ACRBC3_04245 [Burkholderiaceae bacterium]